MTMTRSWRQGLLFVVVSGMGWFIDVVVFMTLSGPVGWTPVAANVVSGSCGSLFVFIVSSRGVFQRNNGAMLQKVIVLLTFNLAVIVASSVLLGAVAGWMGFATQRFGFVLSPAETRLAAKILVTPATLILNFLVVRFLVERFIGLRTLRRDPAVRGEEAA